MSSPRPGQEVLVWYRDRSMPYHGRRGVVRIAGRKRPRNHAVEMSDGAVVVIPAGNLRPPPPRGDDRGP